MTTTFRRTARQVLGCHGPTIPNVADLGSAGASPSKRSNPGNDDGWRASVLASRESESRMGRAHCLHTRGCAAFILFLVNWLLTGAVMARAAERIDFAGFGLGQADCAAGGAARMENIPEEYRQSLWDSITKQYLAALDKNLDDLDRFGVKLNRLFYHYNANAVYDWNRGELIREMTARAWKRGVSLSPILNIGSGGGDWAAAGVRDPAAECGVVLFPSGLRRMDSFNRMCPNNPVGQRVRSEYVARITANLKDEPGFNLLALDDEYGLGYYYAYQQNNCWCAACRSLYRERFRQQAPLPYGPPVGTVIDPKSPLHRWVSLIGVSGDKIPSIARYNNGLRTAARQVKPDLTVSQYPGLDGDLDRVLWEIYGADGYTADLTIQYVRAMVYPRKPPLGMIVGWFADDWLKGKAAEAAQHLRINALLCFANQVREIDIAPVSGVWQYPEVRQEAQAIGKQIEEHSAFFLSLEREPKPVAILWSHLTKTYRSVLSRNWGQWEHGKIWYYKYWPVLRRSHVPLEVITEEQILAGELEHYRALVLVNWEYTTTDVMQKVQAFAKTKPVFRDPTCVLPLPAAKPLEVVDPAAVEQALMPYAGPQAVELVTRDLFCELRNRGSEKVLFIFNPSKEKVTSEIKVRLSGTITEFPTGGSVEATAGESGGQRQFTTAVDANDWRVYRVTP